MWHTNDGINAHIIIHIPKIKMNQKKSFNQIIKISSIKISKLPLILLYSQDEMVSSKRKMVQTMNCWSLSVSVASLLDIRSSRSSRAFNISRAFWYADTTCGESPSKLLELTSILPPCSTSQALYAIRVVFRSARGTDSCRWNKFLIRWICFSLVCHKMK